QGQSLGTPDAIRPPLPRLLGWILQTTTSPDELSRTLSMTAERYRQRAERTIAWYAVYLPILLTVGIGGSTTLLYALAVIGPVWRLLYLLAQR
ncbi:MAG: hypothetical protein JJ992_13430, partial [Planctomycetes bacterium]|nr:hypothetical protein [Planctomycetota bacterium]